MRKILLFLLSFGLASVSPSWAGEEGGQKWLPGSVLHQVESSDTFDSIAQLYGVDVAVLKAINNVDSLVEGLTLSIPPSKKGWPLHQVRSGQTLWRIGKGYGIPVEQIRQANGMDDDRILPGNTLLLPRAKKPEWILPETLATPSTPGENLTLEKGKASAPSSLTEWVEVRLSDNRRAWVRAESLVLGSWQPLGRQELVETARRFVGVPYRWGGTNPNGYDCSGFVQEVFRLAGHSVPRMADAQFESLNKVSKEELSPGDLVFFNTDGSGVSHVGIFSGEGRFLHASSSRGVIESHLDEDYYAARFLGAARIPDWADLGLSLYP